METIVACFQDGLNKRGQPKYTVVFADGKKAVCFSQQAKDLVPGPLPEGWKLEYNAEHPDWPPMLKAPVTGTESGGKREYVPAYHQTKEGQWAEQERMDRRTALMQAVAAIGPQESPLNQTWTIVADAFYKWLRATSGGPPIPAAAQPTTAPPPARDVFAEDDDDVPVYPPPTSNEKYWSGPGQCPQCHAPAGKPHGKPCRS